MRWLSFVLLLGALGLPTAAWCTQDCKKSADVQSDSVPRHGCSGPDPFSLKPDSPFSDELQDKFRKGFEPPIENNLGPARPPAKSFSPSTKVPR